METQTFEFLDNYSKEDKGSLIEILQKVQEHLGYISKASIEYISELLLTSESEVYGVATFYKQFRFNPPGRHSIRICKGTACHVRGADFLGDAIERKLEICTGETTADKRYDFDRVACLGCCALAPVIQIDGDFYSNMTINKLDEVIDQYE